MKNLERTRGIDLLTVMSSEPFRASGMSCVTLRDEGISMGVLRHRVTVTYEAEAEEKTSETIIQKIFDELPVP